MKQSDIVTYLDDKNISHAIKGFSYLISAVSIVAEDRNALNRMTGEKGIYSRIAEEHGTAASRVERAIRHAIEITGGEKTTNSEFIARAADHFIYGGDASCEPNAPSVGSTGESV